jgi:hypothetical protein
MRTLVTFILLLLMATPLTAATGKIPEKLSYDLSWGLIPIGTASQSITASGDSVQISAQFRSNGWLSSFYPVDNRIDTILSKKTGIFPGEVRQFRMRYREGAKVRDRSITFDHSTNVAHFKDHLTNEEVRTQVRPGTSDVTTSFYQTRHSPLTVGDTIHLPVMDGKEPYLLEVKIVKTEKLRTILGKVETLVVVPLVRSEGTFEGKRGVKLWLTNDARRIPVKIQTGVTVGSVTATLTKIE